MLELNELAFSEVGHIYYLNGVEIPSVSRIIEPISKAAYGDVDPVVLRNAANRGTLVHEAIENYNTIGVMDVRDDLKWYCDAYIKWAEKWFPKIEASETKVYHKLMRYAGTVDLLARVNDELWLVDFKTSYKAVHKNYRLQLEAYRQALGTHGVEVDRKLVLHLGKTGTYEEYEYPLADAEAWRVFTACKIIYDFTKKEV